MNMKQDRRGQGDDAVQVLFGGTEKMTLSFRLWGAGCLPRSQIWTSVYEPIISVKILVREKVKAAP
jgi:hypothetical protein